ncbi:hypothetical protein N7451_004338 [Penicillium sp. IBT 35674x]|nr:hypothetical protein N7451_004338 [Penicillium sp. IBT 35674x]
MGFNRFNEWPIYLVYLTPRAVGSVVYLLVKSYCIAQHAATAVDILRTITEPPLCQLFRMARLAIGGGLIKICFSYLSLLLFTPFSLFIILVVDIVYAWMLLKVGLPASSGSA